MSKNFELTYMGETYTVSPSIGCYKVTDAYNEMLKDNGLPAYENDLYGLALIIKDDEGNEDIPTVSLGQFLGEKNVAYIDVNNYGFEMVDALKQANVLKLTGYIGTSGFVTYPLCAFTPEFIEAVKDDDGYKRYSQAHDDYMEYLEYKLSDPYIEPEEYDESSR